MKCRLLPFGIGAAALLSLAATASVLNLRRPVAEKVPADQLLSAQTSPEELLRSKAERNTEISTEWQLPAQGRLQLSDSPEKWSAASSSYRNPRMASGTRQAVTADQLAGYYVEYDTLLSSQGVSARRSTAQLASASGQSGNIQVLKLAGSEMTGMYGTLSGSTLTIPAGNYCQVSNASGATTMATVCPVDPNKLVYYPNEPIVATVTDDGSIMMPSWGVFVIDSATSQASIVEVTVSARLEKANGIMSGTNAVSGVKVEWPVMVTQEYANRITVQNFGNTGMEAFVDLRYDGTAEIAPQYMGTTTQYGEFDCMSLTASGNGDPYTCMKGQVAEGNTVINLPDWGVLAVASPSAYAIKLTDARLTLQGMTIALPEKLPTDFAGAGTESNPYQIASYENLLALSQMVADGADQKGVFFRQTANIDAASKKNYYFSPIGVITNNADFINNSNTITGTPFNGTYDGNSFSIAGIDYECGRRSHTGLFSWVGPEGRLKNVTVSGCQFLTAGIGCGAIAGMNEGVISGCQSLSNNVLFTAFDGGGVAGASRGLVEGCVSTSTVMGYGNVGGITGSASGSIRDCQVRGAMTFMGVSNSLYASAGGVTGTLNASFATETYPAVVERCISAIAVTDRSSVGNTGGLIGSSLASSSKIPAEVRENICITTLASNAVYVQTGASTYSSGRVGGLIGNLWRTRVTDNVLAGVVMAPNNPRYCGAVTGYIMSDKDNKIENLVSSCQMVVSDATPAAANAIYSQLTETYAGYLTNVYYDKQTVGLDFTDFNFKGALTTAAMTGAAGLEGLPADKWVFTDGLYPQLKCFAGNDASLIAAAPIFLVGDETSRMVMSNFTLSTANNVNWGIIGDSGLTTTGQGLDIQGGTAVLKNEFATDILCAYISNSPILKQIIINTTPSSLFAGAGTEEDPYQIRNLNDLKNLQDATTTQGLTYEGVYFKVMNDIDCSGDIGFEGIAADGVTAHEFSGIFDGGGHVIDNVVLNKVNFDASGKALTSGSKSFGGFIGRLSAKGTVKNVVLGPGCRMTFWASSGGVVGYAMGRVENCVNQGQVDGMSTNIGGVVGYLYTGGVVSGCVNEGIVRSGLNYLGGVVGYHNGVLVEKCQNNGIVIGDSINPYHRPGNANYVGGVIGNVVGKPVQYCVNQGKAIGRKAVGGVVGYYSAAATFTGIVNTGEAYSDEGAALGAITGSSSGTTAKFINCYYDGQLFTAGAVNRNAKEGVTGLNTSVLTSGQAIEGLPDSVFDFSANAYPVLKSQTGNTRSQQLRHIYITLPAGVTLSDMNADASLAQYDGLSWQLDASSADIYSIQGQTLKVGEITDKQLKQGEITGSIGAQTRTFAFTTVPDMFEGKGTETNPYLITSKSDMLKLAALVNDDGITYDNKHFRLTADLDYTNDTVFVPIGHNAGVFGGIFNGDNHTISNLSVSHLAGMALFGTVNENGAIRNLTLKDGVFSAASKSVSGFAISCAGTIENCVNYNRINAGADTKATYAGGIVYELTSTGRVTNCVNYGSIEGRSGQSGGIVSTIARGGVVSDCRNEGPIVLLGTQTGGIAGRCMGTIRNCVNESDLKGDKSQFGGIAGYSSDTCRIENSVNKGDIVITSGTGTKIGGVIGYAASTTFIINCLNYGNVTSNSTSTTAYIGGIIGHGIKTHLASTTNYGDVESLNGQYAGGLIGYADAGTGSVVSYYNDSYNYGTVKGGHKYNGGLFGYQRYSNIVTHCGNYGNVIGTGTKAASDNTAGVAGNSSADFTDCFNTGDVTAAGILTAGFMSEGSGNSIINCFNTGAITSTATNATATNPSAVGFWAKGRSDTLANCYNMGAITGVNYASGFVGNFTVKVNVTDCYNAGTVTATADNATTAAFMLSVPTGTENVINNNFYDSDVVTATGGNAGAASAIPTAEFMGFAPSAAYLGVPACYPTLKTLSDVAQANFAAAQLTFKTPQENADNVLHTMTIGLLEGIVWTCSPELQIADNRVLLIAKDKIGTPAWIEKAGGNITRRYNLTLNDNTGVEQTETGLEIISRTYYTPQGITVAVPQPGQILIVKTLYIDGTATVARIIYR